jgi:hypothetical protein
MDIFYALFLEGRFNSSVLTKLVTISTTHRVTRPIRHDSASCDSPALSRPATGASQIKNGVGRVATDQIDWLEKPDRWMVY